MKGRVSAVHDDDLYEYVEKLGVRRRLERGEMTCFECHDPLSLENISAIFPDSGAIKGVCNKLDCLSALMRWREERRHG